MNKIKFTLYLILCFTILGCSNDGINEEIQNIKVLNCIQDINGECIGLSSESIAQNPIDVEFYGDLHNLGMDYFVYGYNNPNVEFNSAQTNGQNVVAYLEEYFLDQINRTDSKISEYDELNDLIIPEQAHHIFFTREMSDFNVYDLQPCYAYNINESKEIISHYANLDITNNRILNEFVEKLDDNYNHRITDSELLTFCREKR